jgi:dsDNA-specific endonuclease/ATPase MutS2
MSESRSIDLHNFTIAEAIREFVRFYNACVRSGYRGRLEVIHGYGKSGSGGVIREELRKFLKAHEETFGEFLAGESLRNPGVTILYPRETQAVMPLGLGGGISSVGYKKPFRKPS